jgi:hypothetical protein
MRQDFQNENEPIGDFKFPVNEPKPVKPYPGRGKIFPLFLKGAVLVVVGVMGIRCSFFVGAGFAEGEVSYFSMESFLRAKGFVPIVTFETADGEKVTFRAGITSHEIKYAKGEHVSVVYKKNDPKNAAIFSFMGFWFNWILICGIAVLVWFGFTVVYYGYGD